MKPLKIPLSPRTASGRCHPAWLALLAALWLLPQASAQTFDFTDITNWTGTGTNEAALVIDWNDGKQPESIAWGFRWNGTATGLQMIQAIDAADPRLQVFYQYGGTYVYGIGYDLNDNGGTFTPGTPGFDSQGNSTETGSGSDPADHYEEGVYSKFFGYDISSADPYGGGGTWTPSNTGADTRVLTDGAWDGYSLSYDETNFTVPDPGLPTAAAPVPEPTAAGWLALGGAGLVICVFGSRLRRARRG